MLHHCYCRAQITMSAIFDTFIGGFQILRSIITLFIQLCVFGVLLFAPGHIRLNKSYQARYLNTFFLYLMICRKCICIVNCWRKYMQTLNKYRHCIIVVMNISFSKIFLYNILRPVQCTTRCKTNFNYTSVLQLSWMKVLFIVLL